MLQEKRANANVVAIRRFDETIFGMRTGLFGHPRTVVLRVPDEKLVGSLEDNRELGELVTQVGLLTLGALFNVNLAFGVEGIPTAMAKWAGIDVEALKKAAAEEAKAEKAALAAEGKVLEVDEDGDEVIRTVEEDEEFAAMDAVDLGGES